jgi:hypothetical protein
VPWRAALASSSPAPFLAAVESSGLPQDIGSTCAYTNDSARTFSKLQTRSVCAGNPAARRLRPANRADQKTGLLWLTSVGGPGVIYWPVRKFQPARHALTVEMRSSSHKKIQRPSACLRSGQPHPGSGRPPRAARCFERLAALNQEASAMPQRFRFLRWWLWRKLRSLRRKLGRVHLDEAAANPHHLLRGILTVRSDLRSDKSVPRRSRVGAVWTPGGLPRRNQNRAPIVAKA